MYKIAMLPLLLALAACATPREACISQAAAESRAIEARIRTVSGNINRGYAVHLSRRPSIGIVTCTGGSSLRICQGISDGPRETPVAIDVTEERRKLAALQDQLAEARKRQNASVSACQAGYPA